MEGVGHQAECAVGVAADAVEVDLVGLEAGCLIGDVGNVAAVDGDRCRDVLKIIVEEVLHAAERAHALFACCADEDDVARVLDTRRVAGADHREDHGQGACVVADAGSMEEAVLLLYLLDTNGGYRGKTEK